ncbi:Exopolysaccharide synthesis, ExoD [Cylindrospermopsis raciborskii CS-505]|nr:Exopolysaccharide synthesis, ExoD [Cylindrospermopsis raciborskii CS-505]
MAPLVCSYHCKCFWAGDRPGYQKKIANYQFPRVFAQTILHNLGRVTRLLEKIARPRLTKLANHDITWKCNGLCISWLAILLISPVPLTNPIPTIGILLFAAASMESDGLLVCICYILTLLITLIFYLIVYGVLQLPGLIT